jgi:hypothetical protein
MPFFCLLFFERSRDNAVGIATSYGNGRPRGRSSSHSRVKNFLFSKSSRPALRSTQPPIQWVTGALSAGVKRPGREVDHSPPTSAEVKKIWIYTSTLHTPVATPLPIHRTIQTQNKRTQTSISRTGLELMIPVFEEANTVHALDLATAGITLYKLTLIPVNDYVITEVSSAIQSLPSR